MEVHRNVPEGSISRQGMLRNSMGKIIWIRLSMESVDRAPSVLMYGYFRRHAVVYLIHFYCSVPGTHAVVTQKVFFSKNVLHYIVERLIFMVRFKLTRVDLCDMGHVSCVGPVLQYTDVTQHLTMAGNDLL